MTDQSSSATISQAVPPASTVEGLERARAILRGTQRLLRSLDFESLSEVSLGNGRRADLMAVRRDGQIWIIEIKSSIADFRSDQKWPEYQDYCDALLFAVALDFPSEILPITSGLVLADAYAGELVRCPNHHPLSAPRRRAVTIAFARAAAMRLHACIDPGFLSE